MLTNADLPRFIFSSSQVNIGECGIWLYAGSSAGAWTMPVRQPSYTAGQQRRADADVYWVCCLPTAAALTITRASTDNFIYAGTTSNSITIMPGEAVMIVNDGAYWLVLPGAIPPAVYRKTVLSSGTSLTLSRAGSLYMFNGGSATVWTLPALVNNTGLEYHIKNRGAADITLQRAGSDQLYTSAAVNSITITAGNAAHVINDGTYWLVMRNGS